MMKIDFDVSFYGVSRCISAGIGLSFSQFKSEIEAQFVGVDFRCVKIVCQVGSLSEIVVECEYDFDNLFRLCGVVSVVNVNIVLVPIEQVCVVAENDGLALGMQESSSILRVSDFGVRKASSRNRIVESGSNGAVDILTDLCLGVCEHEVSTRPLFTDHILYEENLCSVSAPDEVRTILDVCLGNEFVSGVNMRGSISSYEGPIFVQTPDIDSVFEDVELSAVDLISFEGQNGSELVENQVDDEWEMCRQNRKRNEQSRVNIDMAVPSFDICPTNKKKALLSDEWGDLLKAGLDCKWMGGAAHFRMELIKYSTHMGFKFRYVRNDSRYVHVVCQEDGLTGCNWFIKAKKHTALPRFLVDKANFIHKCVGKISQNNGKRMSPSLIGEIVLDNVKQKPETSGKDIMKILQLDYGIEIPYWKAWRTADAARARLFGTFDDSYNELRWYCRAVVDTNPGSVVSLEIAPRTNRFERVFITLNAYVQGFKYCRPIIFIDATFLKGRATGTLLIATAKDGDNGLFPVAFAVVSAENTKNWEWFLCKIKECVTHSHKICFISDRNNGLLAALAKLFGKHANFFCLYHLLANLKLRFPKVWTNTHRENVLECFKACAYAPTVSIFEEKMKIFKLEGGKRAELWIKDIPVENWAVCHSPIWTRYGEMTSNAAESFNAWISKEREMPITYMIDLIRVGINKWHVERRKASNLLIGCLVPAKEVVWRNLSNLGRSWNVVEASSGAYEVMSSPSATVQLASCSCSCMQWQITGFPCAHAVAVIKRVCDNVSKYVDPFFYASTYRDSYMFDIHPIPETERFHNFNDSLPKVKIMPPVLKRGPGRPRKERISVYGNRKKIKKSPCERCGESSKYDFWTCSRSPTNI